MKSSATLGLAGILLAFVSTATARIGETLDQCQLRYGVMTHVVAGKHQDYPQYCFQKGDVEIRVRLYNSLSAQETFLPLRGHLSAGQVEEIEASNNQKYAGKEVIQELRKNRQTHTEYFVVTTAEFHKVFAEPRGSGF